MFGQGRNFAAAGRQILLTAARTAAGAAPTGTGRYWEIPATAGNFVPVGHGDDHYLILEKTGNYQFMASSPKASSPQVVQALAVELASPADRAAWQRAGSPTTWRVNQEFGLATPLGPSADEMFSITTGRSQLFDLDASSGSRPFPVGDRFLSARQLLALPASPARLKQLLLAGYTGGYGDPSAYLFMTAPTVLDMPVAPAVRSALYHMLATLPGVRSAGTVPDVAGQPGTGVSLTGRYSHCGNYATSRFIPSPTGHQVLMESSVVNGHTVVKKVRGRSVSGSIFASCVVQQRLIINPATGLPLAQELRYTRLPAGQHWSAPGGLFSFEVFGTPHWTSVLPHRNPRGH